MAYKRTTRRGGGKKKALLSEVYMFPPLDETEDFDEIVEMLNLLFRDLETYLIEAEEISKAIVKAHDLPTTRREILPYVNNYDLPINVSYAVDILFSVYEVREFIKKGDASNAAAAGIRLGSYVARSESEFVAGDRESRRTAGATDRRITAKELRQKRMEEIAIEKGWQPGKKLSKTQLQAIYTLLRERHPEYKDKPKNQILSRDARKIGLRK